MFIYPFLVAVALISAAASLYYFIYRNDIQKAIRYAMRYV